MQAVFFQENTISSLVSQLIAPETKHDGIDFSYLNSQAKSLGIELAIPRKVVIIDIKDFERTVKSIQFDESLSNDAEIHIQTAKMSILKRIREIFNDTQDIVSNVGSDKYVAILRIRTTLSASSEQLHSKAKQLANTLAQSGFLATIGIGTLAQNSSALKESFRSAWCAINIGKKLTTIETVHDIDELSIQDMILSANRQKIKDYASKMLASFLNHAHWNTEYELTLREWLHSQNPGCSARNLGLHRNSFLYRINRISEIGGVDVKDPDVIFHLKLAFLIHDLT